jgi:glycine dehydrogenase
LFVDQHVFVSTLAVLHTRMKPQGIKIVKGDYKTFEFTPDVFGAIVQYPNKNGSIEDYRSFVSKANENGTRVTILSDHFANIYMRTITVRLFQIEVR